jgi:hypothetical protein
MAGEGAARKWRQYDYAAIEPASQLRQILLVRKEEHVNQLAWKIYRRQSSEPSESGFLAGACDSYELRWWMDQFGKLARRRWRRELCARREQHSIFRS